ncbi:MAG: glycine cleavage system aminomethyltransferase GcvT [Planctomycetes bacterium]|nr:glycine cleavage system aminomethyltransferase GcvT [Planctomycetota bacterium]
MEKSKAAAGEFIFELSKSEPKQSALYNEHLKLTDKSRMADFAGFMMPLWYSSISNEHKAVRCAAGLFDCTHMGVLEFAGKDAADFLNLIATNDVNTLTEGSAQYSYVIDAAGNILDDIIVYRRGKEKFMVVVNAGNEPKIKAYLAALQSGKAILDIDNPKRKLELNPAISDMKETEFGSDGRVDIALQGPASLDILLALTQDEKIKEQIKEVKPFKFTQAVIAGIDCIISRTGYTGAKISFELFVSPAKAAQLWELLLENGKSFGLEPCGLGARDSLRIEAGLPLYGHELSGDFDISPFEAGYGWAVKLQKEFFIGKNAMQQRAKDYDMQVARIKISAAAGVRPVRQNDAVLNENGKCVGWILSCAKAGENQLALAYVEKESTKENQPLGIYYLARSKRQMEDGKKQSVQKNEQLKKDIEAITVSRFEKF